MLPISRARRSLELLSTTLLVLSLLATTVSGHSVYATNDLIPGTFANAFLTVPIYVQGSPNGQNTTTAIIPLGNANQSVNLQGTLMLANNGSGTQRNAHSIALISCDSTTATEDFTAAQNTMPGPVAILLYSMAMRHCAYNSSDGMGALVIPVFSTISSATAGMLQDTVRSAGQNGVTSVIRTTASSTTGDAPNGTNTTPGSTGVPTSNPMANTGSSTTQVAMIILYSITGLITGLFLVIIVTGALRAHRHPERYGPRATGRFGALRQSRARGVARAVLDSIPIVKFGGNEEELAEENKDEDVEMNQRAVQQERDMMDDVADKDKTPEMVEHGAVLGRPLTGASMAEGSTARSQLDGIEESGEGSTARKSRDLTTAAALADATEKMNGDDIEEDTSRVSKQKDKGKIVDDDSPTCSICTEEFVKGDDQRVLPCKHAYHPACVDPWLLNNGTCPLCRIDLQDLHPDLPNPEDYNPSLEPEDQTIQSPRRLSRMYTDMRRLSHAQPEERVAALRRLRDETRGLVASASPVPSSAFRRRSGNPQSEDESDEANRRSSRLSDVLRRKKRRGSAQATSSRDVSSSEDVTIPPRLVVRDSTVQAASSTVSVDTSADSALRAEAATEAPRAEPSTAQSSLRTDQAALSGPAESTESKS